MRSTPGLFSFCALCALCPTRKQGNLYARSVRLAARTLAFQAGNGGSIPPRIIGTCGVAARTLPCQGGSAGSIPARCFARGDTAILADPSTPPSNSGEFASLSSWRHGFNSRRGRCPILDCEFRISDFGFQSAIKNPQSEMEMTRYANRQSGRAQTSEIVGSTPTRVTRRKCPGRPGGL